MGAWADGNFDNDTALDFVADVAHEATREMSPPTGAEDLDLVMAAVAIRLALVQHCRAPKPKRADVEGLRAAVLKVYDDEIDELDPTPEYKVGRRDVIADTFDQLLAASR